MGNTFLIYVTAHNAPAWRDEIFAALRDSRLAPENGKHDWTLNREEKLERIRLWIREAVNPASDLAQLYRKLEPGLDLETDIVMGLPAFETTPGFGPLEAHYSLRMLWRVLVRRHAIREAKQLERLLSRNENRVWKYWRRKDYWLPRILVGVLLGFFTLGSSSGVVDTIYRLRTHWWWPLAPAGCVMSVYCLALADIQRQVGRITPWHIVRRAARVVAFGAWYAICGGVILWARTASLDYPVDDYLPVAVICSGVALLLGFVFQLFWQDRSIGEPL